MHPIPWSVIAFGLGVATVVVLVGTLLVEHLAKRYPFYARFVSAISALLGAAAITVVANPSTLENPVLSGARVALTAIFAV